MRIAICDDEKAQRDLFLEYCHRFDSSLKVDCYESASDLLRAEDRMAYEIVFLDIEMPAPNGFEVAKELRKKEKPPLVIFVTKSSTYTIQGYGIAFRYLPKPIDYETFAAALTLAIKEYEPEKISFMSDGVYNVLTVQDIVFCEALDHALTVHTTTKDYAARMTLAELSSQLPAEDFAQSHKSFLVNLRFVQSAGANSTTLAWKDGSIEVPLSKGKRKQFMKQLGDYIGR